MAEKIEKTKTMDGKALETLVAFWVPIHAFEGKKGIVYESRHERKRVFLKHVKRSKHYFFKYEAWAIDEDILGDLQDYKVEQVYILVKGEGLFMATMDTFMEKSIVDEYPPHGMQSFLPESEWEVIWRE